jgi:sugar lactone lactonase YvrE
VHALDVTSGAHRSFGVGDTVGTVGLTRSGGLVLALGGGFALSGPDGQDLRTFGDFSADQSVTRFNDGKPDPWGSFWAGTMAVPEDSGFPCSLYRLSPDGVVTELFGGVGLSNGLDWSDDRRVFYYSDSHAGGVDAFDTNPDTGALRRYTPDGRLDTIVKLPVSQVSSATFGGADLSTLYITTARESFTAADLAAEPHAGDIFACTPGVTGRPPFLFGR